MSLSSSVVVITGAANGIGSALVTVCLQKGMQVVMTDKEAQSLASKFDMLEDDEKKRVHLLTCDVTCFEDLQEVANETMKRFKRIDWLINNAGISGHLLPFWELSLEEIERVMQVNLYGAVHGIKAFLPLMFSQAHRSRIINIASFYGLCAGSYVSAYSMSKYALVALSESLYFDCIRYKKPIDISVACPSFTNTSLLHHTMPQPQGLHALVSELLMRGKDPLDVASYIVTEALSGAFYIFPDPEVADYCEARGSAIAQRASPYENNVEKIMKALTERASLS